MKYKQIDLGKQVERIYKNIFFMSMINIIIPVSIALDAQVKKFVQWQQLFNYCKSIIQINVTFAKSIL